MVDKKGVQGNLSYVTESGETIRPEQIRMQIVRTSEGRAYSFFDCNADKKELEEGLSNACFYAQVPSELELTLTEGTENLQGEAQEALKAAQKYSLSRLPKRAREGTNVSYRYALEARFPDSTNTKTARELTSILNQAYQSPLYEKDEKFFGETVYQRGNQYVHAH